MVFLERSFISLNRNFLFLDFSKTSSFERSYNKLSICKAQLESIYIFFVNLIIGEATSIGATKMMKETKEKNIRRIGIRIYQKKADSDGSEDSVYTYSGFRITGRARGRANRRTE